MTHETPTMQYFHTRARLTLTDTEYSLYKATHVLHTRTPCGKSRFTVVLVSLRLRSDISFSLLLPSSQPLFPYSSLAYDGYLASK